MACFAEDTTNSVTSGSQNSRRFMIPHSSRPGPSGAALFVPLPQCSTKSLRSSLNQTGISIVDGEFPFRRNISAALPFLFGRGTVAGSEAVALWSVLPSSALHWERRSQGFTTDVPALRARSSSHGNTTVSSREQPHWTKRQWLCWNSRPCNAAANIARGGRRSRRTQCALSKALKAWSPASCTRR